MCHRARSAALERDDDTSDDTAGEIREFGPDSHAALADGSEPEGYPVKGNADSMLYHVPGSAFYKRTVAEVWFKTAEAAEAAGFELPPSQRADAGADAVTEDAATEDGEDS